MFVHCVAVCDILILMIQIQIMITDKELVSKNYGVTWTDKSYMTL